MKKTLIVIILLCFLFNSIGYYLFFELDKFFIQKEMQALLNHDPADVIMITVADAGQNHEFYRIDQHEFKFKGRLYDVVREINKGSSILFLCRQDSKEEALFAGLKKAHLRKIFLALWDHVINFSFSAQPETSCNTFFTEVSFHEILFSLTSSFLPHWSPPPEYC